MVNQKKSQGIKNSGLLSLTTASGLWRRVAQQVLDQGLCLGVAADFPKRSGANTAGLHHAIRGQHTNSKRAKTCS